MKFATSAKQICFFASALSLFGCALSPFNIHPSDLKPVTTNQVLQLTEPVVYKKTLAENIYEYTLAKGGYKAVFEDDKGTYYRGPGTCIKFELISAQDFFQKKMLNKPGYMRCGVYLSSTKPITIKIYIQPGSFMEPENPEQSFQETSSDTALTPAQQAVAGDMIGGSIVGATATWETNITAVQAGIGGAIGVGIISALEYADRDNMKFFSTLPEAGILEKAFSVE